MKNYLHPIFFITLLATIAAALFTPAAAGAAAHPSFKGYYKNIYAVSEPAAGQGFYSDLNRLRLVLDVPFDSGLTAHIAYDNEVYLGSVLDTAEFKAAKDARGDNLFDLSATVVDKGDLFWSHSIHRAYLRFARGPVTVTAGRQRVPLGTGHIWNPTDLLDPISPLQLERDERGGTDAVDLEVSTGPVSAATLAYAPGRGKGFESWFARQRVNTKGFDISGMLGSFRGTLVAGLDFSGYAGDSGVRGEFTYTAPREGEWFARALVGFDHTFPSTLYLSVEYLFNGGADPSLSLDSAGGSTSADILTKNRNFIGATAAYEITPLLTFTSLAVFDIDGKGAFLGPSLKYNLFEDLDIGAGAQVFTGKENSEYGQVPDLYYCELQLYF